MQEEARTRRSRTLRAVGVFIGAPMVLAPLAIGTVHRETRLVVFALCSLALLAALVERTVNRRRAVLAPPAYALGLAVFLTAVQLMPLPRSLLAIVSPTAADLGASAITLDGAATTGELAKLGAYLAFFLAASIYGVRSHRRRLLVLAVVGVAAAVAALAFLQAALGETKILFFYRPRAEWTSLMRGTFVNPNHFGALLALAAPCALAWGLAEPRWRWPAFATVFVLDAAVVLSMGRMSIIATAVGQVVALVLLRGKRTERGRVALAAGVIAAAMLAGAVVGRNRLGQQVSATLEGEDVRTPGSKVNVWADAARLVPEFPWTGVGRGAFEHAFQRVSSEGGRVRYEWAENIYLQAPIDWGVPAALALCGLAVWALVRGWRSARSEPLATGALAGIIALAVHELGDFAVEIPGVALPALAVLASMYRAREEGSVVQLRAQRAYWSLAILLAVPLVREAVMPTAEEDGAALAALVRNPLVSVDEVRREGERVHRRHPADAYIPTLIAERLGAARQPDTMSWVNKAMVRNPVHPIPHLMAAEVLAEAGRKEQALGEYRLAAAGAPDPRTLVYPRARQRYPAIEDLLAATPPDRARLYLLAKWLRPIAPADSEKVYERLAEIDPANVRARRELVAFAIERRDGATAADRLRALLAVDHDPPSARLAARERILAGDLAAAARMLDAASDRSHDAFSVELELADAVSRSGAIVPARARLDRLLGWPLDKTQRERLHGVRAENERRGGNEHQYRWELDQRDRLRKP